MSDKPEPNHLVDSSVRVTDDSQTTTEHITQRNIITDRLNLDNFWSLIFASCMTISFAAPAYLFPAREHKKVMGEFGLMAAIVMWTAMVCTPLIIRQLNKVTYDRGSKKFFNSQGQDITRRIPSKLIWLLTFRMIMFAGVAIVVAASVTQIPFLIISGLFFGTALYFIAINCPMTILLNGSFWVGRHIEQRPKAP